MPMGTAAGYPQMASVGSPEIWSTKILTKFYASSVLPQISNTDYEGEIKKFGCKVIIRTRPDVTVNTGYTKGQQLTIQNLVPGKVELEIDQAQWWFIGIDDVDRFQADIAYMEDWTQDAGEQNKIKLDTTVLGAVYADAAATNKGAAAGKESGDINMGSSGAPLVFTKDTALGIIVDCNVVWDEANVPESDRKLVLPAWACGAIRKSDIKDASITGDGVSVLRSGRIGLVDRCEVYSSNLLAKATDSTSKKAWHALGAQRKGICFASQFVQNQVFKQLEQQFGSAARGLHVFGYKVLKSECLIDLYISKS